MKKKYWVSFGLLIGALIIGTAAWNLILKYSLNPVASTQLSTTGTANEIRQENKAAGSVLYDIWGSSPSDVFAVGNNGSILHYDGSSWDVNNSLTSIQLNDVWGNSPSDVFAVGSSVEDNVGIILHYNGDEWSTMTTTKYSLDAIWGSPSCGVWATGHGGTILHYDNTKWVPLPGS